VLEALTYLRSQALRRLHILVTSRDEVDIRESLHPSSFEDITMKNEEVDEDIAAFISGLHVLQARKIIPISKFENLLTSLRQISMGGMSV
jgi:hypothetical protein